MGLSSDCNSIANNTNQANKPLLTASLLLIAFLGAVFLSVESFFSLQGKSLCKTSACEIVGSYLNINESLLVSAGAGLFWLLFALLYFSKKYKNLNICIYLIFAVALSFDGALIGFQFFTIKQKCLLCMGVASFLLLLSTLFCLTRKSPLGPLIFILIWLGSFSANALFEMPYKTGAIDNMVFYHFTPTNQQHQETTRMTLVFSMNCPHCLKVISFLARQSVTGDEWRLAAVDQDKKSVEKIASFVSQSSAYKNFFALLKKTKTTELTHSSSKTTLSTLTNRNKDALSFLANLNIQTVPVLLVEEKRGKKLLLTQSSSIMALLQSHYGEQTQRSSVQPLP